MTATRAADEWGKVPSHPHQASEALDLTMTEVAREALDLTMTETLVGHHVSEAGKRFRKASEHPYLPNDWSDELKKSAELIQARRELKQLRASHVQVSS